jgi:hypothetical protein
MKSIEYVLHVDEGPIVIDIPNEMKGKKLKISLTEDFPGAVVKFSELPLEERLTVLEQYKGKAKFPNFPIDKYDVYEQ